MYKFFGEYVGRIRAASYVEIHARVEGYLERMLFVEGKQVKQNEPLFIINSALYKARVEKAKAQLKKERSSGGKSQKRCRAFTAVVRTACGQPVGS